MPDFGDETPQSGPQAPAPPHRDPSDVGRIERATVAELTKLEQIETVEGALAAALARDLDGEIPPAGRSSMGKQLSAMMAEIRSHAPVEPDELDALTGAAAALWNGARNG